MKHGNFPFQNNNNNNSYETLVFEGGTLMASRLTSHYSFRYMVYYSWGSELKDMKTLMRKIGRFSMFHLRGKADVMEQKPSGKIWNQHTFLGVSATSWWWKNWRKSRLLKIQLMDHPKYFSFWWISPFSFKKSLGNIYCCNLCRVPIRWMWGVETSTVNTWESMLLANKTFQKIYLPTMMLKNCNSWI